VHNGLNAATVGNLGSYSGHLL